MARSTRSQRFNNPAKITQIRDDHPDGVSGARFAEANNGSWYAIKGAKYAPNHPQLVANELVAAELLEVLGMPYLDFRLLKDDEGNIFYGSSMVALNGFDALTPKLFSRADNKDFIYQLACFDALILNGDRHGGNLRARRDGNANDSNSPIRLVPIDHSHCLILPAQSAHDLEPLIDAPLTTAHRNPVLLNFVAQQITDWTKIDEALSMIEGITDDDLDTIVNNIPDPLLSRHEREVYIRVLKGRRRQLRKLFKEDRACLPFLDRLAA